MNVLLIFFAIPLAVIILSAIIESLINCPLKVTGIFFSIFIVVAFALGGTVDYIVAAIVYTIISFITAILIRVIINRRCCCGSTNNCNSCNNCNPCNNCNLNVLNELSRLGLNSNLDTQNILSDSSNLNENNINNTCRRYR